MTIPKWEEIPEEEYDNLLMCQHSARYLLEDFRSEEGMEMVAEFTGLPMGVIVSAFNNIFKNCPTEEEQFKLFELKKSNPPDMEAIEKLEKEIYNRYVPTAQKLKDE